MIQNEYVIQLNRYDSHTIVAERNPSKYIILELFFQRAWGIEAHAIIISSVDLLAERRSNGK